MKIKIIMTLMMCLLGFNVLDVHADYDGMQNYTINFNDSSNYSQIDFKVAKLDNKYDSTNDDYCYSLLGEQFSKVLDNILKFIQYLAPILVVVLSFVDLVKAAISGEADALKKMLSKFWKRLVAAMFLFFMPLLTSVILEIVGIVPPSSCFEKLP